MRIRLISYLYLLLISTLLLIPRAYSASDLVEVLPNVYVNRDLPSDTVLPISNRYGCDKNEEHEKPPGISHFCLKHNSSLDIVNGRYIIEGQYTGTCPEYSSRETRSTICIKHHLGLAIVDRQIKLVEQKLTCPEGYEQKTGELVCSSIQDATTPQALLDAEPECIPNFIKAKHQTLCRTMEIVEGTSASLDDDDHVSSEECESDSDPGWKRNYYTGFCLPAFCGEPQGLDPDICDTDVQQIYKIKDAKANTACCSDSSAYMVRNVPLHTQFGLSAVPIVMCAPAFGKHVICPDPEKDPGLTSGNR